MAMGAVLLTAGTALLTGCQDDWNEHYNQQADSQYGTESLYEIIASRTDLSDFRQVLDSARLFSGNRISSVHYSQLLGTDQFLTVWAPVNGTFNKDSLLQLCQTAHGDSLVELHFLKNHIARFANSAVAGRSKLVKMLNGKTLSMVGMKHGDAEIQEANIASRNGVLHVVKSPVTYRYNIYEALFSLDKYNHIGNFLQSYQIDKFDETQSLAMGVVDGKTVYVDSVFQATNILLNTNVYGHIDSEDSTYWMLVPDRTLWDSLYAEASTYYQYGQTPKADSLHDYWSNYALIQDLVYNPMVQRSIRDSICSTTWTSDWGGRRHVYYQPFAPGNLWSYCVDSLVCSNGNIYEIKQWPFNQQRTYFTDIKIEAEDRMYDSYEAKGKTLSTQTYTVAADSVSKGYRYFKPQTQYDAYYVIYEVPNVLSGCYDICAVVLPHTVYNPNYTPESNKAEFRPNKFTAELVYTGLDGKEYEVTSSKRYKYDPTTPGYYEAAGNSETSVPFLFDCDLNPNTAATRAFTNDPYRVDTVKLATVHFPTCNYDQQKVTTRLKIQNAITNKQTNTYNAEILLDCLLFLPHTSK